MMMAMDEFLAEVSFRFKAEGVDKAGGAIRRLMQAAEEAGFKLETATVNPAEPKNLGRERATARWLRRQRHSARPRVEQFGC
jgi:hypothetical protein